ncbi:hypothetical protein N665_1015s0006 [Sinapis alba]|nr:hypothetical protein N665_1015s0006 [Sinapis alba]
MDSLWNKDLTKSYTIDGFVQVIQVWVYYALPEFGAEYGHPVQNKPSPPLLAYNGGKGRRFFKDAISHWLAIWISIPKRHIVVWDIIVGCIRKAQLDQVMAPFVNMVPYLLVECAATVKKRCKYSLEPFTYEVVNAPQCESGDCGLFTLKYIECHALGFPFPGSLNPKNNKAIREKMAVDIFEEIPDAHQTEITDVDVNQDMYD